MKGNKKQRYFEFEELIKGKQNLNSDYYFSLRILVHFLSFTYFLSQTFSIHRHLFSLTLVYLHNYRFVC